MMTTDEQLASWLEGKSIHNDTRDECCPDFSCCQSDLLVDRQTRQAFVDADDETRFGMLGMFLGACISKATELNGVNNVNVYISGDAECTRH